MLADTHRAANLARPNPGVVAARLATLFDRITDRCAGEGDARLACELAEELLALEDRVTYSEAMLHHLSADIAALLADRAAGKEAPVG